MSRTKQKGSRPMPTPADPELDHATLLRKVKELASSIDDYLEQYPPDSESKTPSVTSPEASQTLHNAYKGRLRAVINDKNTEEHHTSTSSVASPVSDSGSHHGQSSSQILKETAQEQLESPNQLERPTAPHQETESQDRDFFNEDFIAL